MKGAAPVVGPHYVGVPDPEAPDAAPCRPDLEEEATAAERERDERATLQRLGLPVPPRTRSPG